MRGGESAAKFVERRGSPTIEMQHEGVFGLPDRPHKSFDLTWSAVGKDVKSERHGLPPMRPDSDRG